MNRGGDLHALFYCAENNLVWKKNSLKKLQVNFTKKHKVAHLIQHEILW